MVVQQRECEFFFQRSLGRRRHLDAIVAGRVEHQLLFGYVEEVEKLEVTINRVEARFAPVLVTNEETLLAKNDLLRPPQPRIGDSGPHKRE